MKNDFILDELFTLLENGILAISVEDKYRVTTKGEVFVSAKKIYSGNNPRRFQILCRWLVKRDIS
jgi:hypothetical protein